MCRQYHRGAVLTIFFLATSFDEDIDSIHLVIHCCPMKRIFDKAFFSNSDSLIGSLVRIVALFGSRLGGTFLMFVFTVILLRVSDQDTFGHSMTGIAYLSIASLLLTLNMDAGAIRFIVAYKQEDSAAKLSGFIRFNMRILGLTTGLLYGFIALFAAYYGALDTAVLTLVIGLLAAPIASYIKIAGSQAIAIGLVVRGALPIALGQPFFMCLLLVGYVVSGWVITSEGVMVVAVLAFAFTMILQKAITHKTLAPLSKPSGDFSTKREWLQAGLLLLPQTALNRSLKQIVIAAASVTLVAAQVANFALAISVISLLHFAMKSVDIAYSPSVSKSIQTHDMHGTTHMLRQMAIIRLVGFTLGSLMFFGMLGWFLSFFGEEYLSARGPILILLLLPLAEVIFGPTGLILNVGNKGRLLFGSTLVGAVVLVAATIIGGHFAGASGAAWGCGLSYMLTKALQLFICVRSVGIDPSLLGAWRLG